MIGNTRIKATKLKAGDLFIVPQYARAAGWAIVAEAREVTVSGSEVVIRYTACDMGPQFVLGMSLHGSDVTLSNRDNVTKLVAMSADALMQGIVAGLRDHIDGRNYNPGVDLCADNADWLDGYSHGWQTALEASRTHAYSVREIGGHGYPYRAVCPCGWQSTTYAAAHAAHQMGEAHVTAEAMDTVNVTVTKQQEG